MSDDFISRQKAFKSVIQERLDENEHRKEEKRFRRLNSSKVYLSSESDEEIDILPVDSSVYVSTDTLIRVLDKSKRARKDAVLR